jgi:hypothetical protein
MSAAPLVIDVYNDVFRYEQSGAEFSDCALYRYKLWRRWDHNKSTLAFCMLNPSTADARNNDPTVERCERRARDWGYGSLIVVNLFAWRSTDPRALRSVADPVGPYNFDAILWAIEESTTFVCAWGGDGAILGMGQTILSRLREFYPGRAHALKINGDGTPAHPLYLPYSLKPELIR